ncbi:glycosyltransferase family 2 protein [Rhizobium brockwellii]|uniref:glycosyltransferase family 2 protein n=1 Tax=Rhizobium brockwellii TaxID=3019932 RepID=UPI003F9689E6
MDEQICSLCGNEGICARRIGQFRCAQCVEMEQDGDEVAPAVPRVYVVVPVFNRLHFTRDCLRYLKAQTYQSVQIIISDGGSTDGTPDAVEAEFPDTVVLRSSLELWWTGSMALGIDYALKHSRGSRDCVLMMNNDTQLPVDYIETLILCAQKNDAAVGALIVDSLRPELILDAGEFIDWKNYSFPVKTSIELSERFYENVDVLPGRGTLVPLHMIRAAGNVDAEMLPHYLADYEFFYRLKRKGFRLGVCYDTKILAHIEETGIRPTTGKSAFRKVWHEVFSRRSMSNFWDHWRFVTRHAPNEYRNNIRFRLIKRVIADLTLRTPARPFFFPLYLLLTSPTRAWRAVNGQRRVFSRFAVAFSKDGADVFCRPRLIPGIIRLPVYLAVAPGPIKREHIEENGLLVGELLQKGILRQLRCNGWYALNTIHFGDGAGSKELKQLRTKAWNPIAKVGRTVSWYVASRGTGAAE